MTPPRVHAATLGPLERPVRRRLDQLDAARVVSRIWAHDPTVWRADPLTPELANRLGWLRVLGAMSDQVADLERFAADVRGAFDHVVLCGMGGSSLAPEVLGRSIPTPPSPPLTVLDSTHPAAVIAAGNAATSDRLFVLVSSKSGTTQETLSFYRYLRERIGGRGGQLAGITDPDTPLVQLGTRERFRRVFLNPPDIGGRYSALTYFGLVPAALTAVDISRLLERAAGMAAACGPAVTVDENPAAWLGAVLGEAAVDGRDKLTLVLSPGIASFGLWVEQLIAESTGKEGKGIVPVAGEALGVPAAYGDDRLFVGLRLASERGTATEDGLDRLAAAGHPVVRLVLDDAYDLGAEFFRWELATAVAGAILGINPFDQPNVAESKRNTARVLAERRAPSGVAGPAEVNPFLTRIPRGHYLGLHAYVQPSSQSDQLLAELQRRLRDRLRIAVTVGYGPRFLHSTGQLHKGGPATGHFIQIVDPAAEDVPIPGETFGFATLIAAQAEGDFLALRESGRPVIRVGSLMALE